MYYIYIYEDKRLLIIRFKCLWIVRFQPKHFAKVKNNAYDVKQDMVILNTGTIMILQRRMDMFYYNLIITLIFCIEIII